MDDMDFLLDDETEVVETAKGDPWRVMIIDDDESIHQTTKYALYGFSFLDSPVEWVDAYSAEEAKKIVLENPDVALIFLDVVMETDNAGLDFARWYRDSDINNATRIILRTGQPGQAPERRAIVEYDLHDYKTKTDLTSEKLFTTMITALRSYRDLRIIQQSRTGLGKIIDSMQYLFSLQSMKHYATGVLMQINAIINFRRAGIICARSVGPAESLEILAEVGAFDRNREAIEALLNQSLKTRESIHEDDFTVLTFVDQNGRLFSIYLENKHKLSEVELELIRVFCSSVSVGFGNVKLLEDLKRSHLGMVIAMADLAEKDDTDAVAHVLRISHYVTQTAQKLREMNYQRELFTPEFLEKVGVASILHDIGKAYIPEDILFKPGKLDPRERKIIETHAGLGFQALSKALEQADDKQGYLQLATSIAMNHHEWFDGSGYPNELKGQDIPMEARIVAVADVYDALRQKRCYKESLPKQECVKILEAGKGTQFDPVVVDAFLGVLKEEGEAEGVAVTSAGTWDVTTKPGS